MELTVLFGFGKKKMKKVFSCSCSRSISEFSGIKKRWPEKIGLERIDQLMDVGIIWLQEHNADHHLIELYRTLESRLCTTDKLIGITLKDADKAPIETIIERIITPLLAKHQKVRKIKTAHNHPKHNRSFQKRA